VESPPSSPVAGRGPPPGGVSMFGGPTGGRAGIAAVGAKLNFNPASLLPGAIPLMKEPPKQSVGFDTPAENTNILQSANKVKNTST